jgi:hypothetical protein
MIGVYQGTIPTFGIRSTPADGEGMRNFIQRRTQEHCISAGKDASIERYGGFE